VRITCPKYIKEALKKRAECAIKFTELDIIIGEWLDKHNLYDLVEDYDISGGCESYVNPESSSARILNVIDNA
jgi:hypothetical protein